MVINRKRETDTERTERETDRMSATKYGGSGGFGKALFCNHYSKDQFRQQLPVDAKFKVGEWMTNRIYACLKMSPHNFFISCNGKVVTIL